MKIQSTDAEGTLHLLQYPHMLRRRIAVGRQLADYISHDLTQGDHASRLFRQMEQLESRLATFARYSTDREALLDREDERFHRLQSPPVDLPPCWLCLNVQTRTKICEINVEQQAA